MEPGEDASFPGKADHPRISEVSSVKDGTRREKVRGGSGGDPNPNMRAHEFIYMKILTKMKQLSCILLYTLSSLLKRNRIM